MHGLLLVGKETLPDTDIGYVEQQSKFYKKKTSPLAAYLGIISSINQHVTVESPDKGHFGSNINSAHFVPCRGIVLFRRFYLYYFGTGINFGGLQVCLSKRDYQYIVPSSKCPLSETSLYLNIGKFTPLDVPNQLLILHIVQVLFGFSIACD